MLNSGTGDYMEFVRITVDGTNLEAFTDATGFYQLANVPAGTAAVKAFRTGLPTGSRSVAVQAGETVQADFSLGAVPPPQAGDTVKLAEFVVGTTREMDGAAIAINTQRFAPNFMNVVAGDEFGPVAIGNVGEVLRAVPGVTIGLGGLGAAYTISLNGVPADNVPVSIGGFNLANAAGGQNRAVGVNQISINNMARVEVIYTPTPEITGSALAGSVNMVPRSSFERTKPVYNFTAGMMFRDDARSLGRSSGPESKLTHKNNPTLDFSAIVPVSRNFGFTLSASTLRVFAPQAFAQNTWRGAGSATNGGTLPDTTPDKPYLTDYAVRDSTALQERDTAGFTVDYKLSPHDRFMFSYQYGLTLSEQDNRTLTFFVNRVAPGNFSTAFTHGFAGAGELRHNNQADYLYDTLHMPSISYWHDGPEWKAEAGLGFSRSIRRKTDLAEGYFNTVQASRRNVTISFDDINYLRPGTITVTDGTTGRPVDPYQLDGYQVGTTSSNTLRVNALQRNAFGSLKRDFAWSIPVSLKGGLDFRQSIREQRSSNPTWTFVGADRTANTSDDNAIVALDEALSSRTPPFGFPPTQRVSQEKLYRLYQNNPAYFTVNDAATYTASVTQSKYAQEEIYATYLRGDTQFFSGRLKLTGGVRVEQTNDQGQGQLIDVTRNYQRDASGRVIVGANGRPLTKTSNALEVAQLTNIDRGLKAEKEYLRWFPSLNGSYNVREDLIVRAGYYKSVGRPNFTQYAGSLTLPDLELPAAPDNQIRLNNVAIKAWSADTVKASIEYYFEKVGLLSVSVFRRQIDNFFGNTVFRPSAEFLALYGLDPAVYGNYDVATQYNLQSGVRMDGIDVNYKQALTFLPSWARGVQVFANGSSLRTLGEAEANFAGFVPKTASWGVSLTREKFSTRMRWNYAGRQRRGLVAAGRGIEASTYNWGSKRLIVDWSAEYQLTRRITAFASLHNLLDAPVDMELYGPSTPEVAQFRQRTQYGSLWTIGLKSQF